ncbi:MAG: malonyl-CoA synthase [Alphaproteobacteria bacterium]|nr:malonyl-CoA synthase [Alphaproteobacteria bacterium]
MSGNLYRALSDGFPDDRTRIAIEVPGGACFSFAALDEAVGRISQLLLDLGVRRGGRVMTQVEKSPEAVFLYLATLRIGAIFVPLNPAYREAEMGTFIADAEPAVIVGQPRSEAMLGKLARAHGGGIVLTLGQDASGSLLDRIDGLAPAPRIADLGADEIAAIVYTSGTTGRSKGAMLSHGNLLSNADTLHRIWGWRDGDVLLHALPIYHVHGLFIALHCALLNGSRVIFLPRFEARAVIAQLPRASVFMGVPTFYTRLLGEPEFGMEACANMRLFIAGSAPLLPETFAQFEARSGHRILERYGMTEAGMITSNPLQGERRPGSVGPPLPGVSVRVAGEDGQAMAQGEVGVLEIKGPNVFRGYWRMEEKTAEEFREDGYFITGDLARIDEDGAVAIVGRAKDMVVCGGLNVYPKEIEAVIDALDGVGESAVFGLPHPDFGEAVAAEVTLDNPHADLDEARIIESVRAQLSGFKVPKRVFVVDALPRNPMGKVQKKTLRERYAETFKG